LGILKRDEGLHPIPGGNRAPPEERNKKDKIEEQQMHAQ
jgi:hypothetical protein